MLTKAEVDQIIEKCGHDGHTIYKAEAFDFLPRGFIEPLVREYKSDGSAKGSIYGNDGEMLPSLKGIYGLDLLYAVAHNICADTKEAESKIGRGFQASALTNAIQTINSKRSHSSVG